MFDIQPIKHEIEVLGFHSIYYFEFTKNFSHAPEKHDFWEMVYVDNGRVIAITDGVGIPLAQGQVIFHEPNETHAHISDNISGNNMLVISFSASSEAMKFFSRKTFTLDKTAKTLLSLFLDEAQIALNHVPDSYENKSNLNFSNAPLGSTQLLQCYMTEFLIKLMRDGQSSKIRANEHSRAIAGDSMTQLIKDYLAENIYSDMSIEILCNRFKMGKSQLIKIFKDSSSKSPMEYFYSLRLSESKKLLRDGKYSITEISDLFGYSNVHNFSRAFKRATGFSPTSYVKSIK